MWISRKRIKELEMKIADLEVQVQSQQIKFEDGIKNLKILGDKLESLARIANF